MEPPQTFYKQSASHLAFDLFLRPETIVDGELILRLAEIFIDDLLFPGTRPIALHTQRPEIGTKLNMGEFSERRWTAGKKKILAGEYGVLAIRAETPDFPNQQIWLNVVVNPRGSTELHAPGIMSLSCSMSYLRHLAQSSEKVESLLRFGTTAWNGVQGGCAYGFANLALIPKRPEFRFDPDGTIRMSEPPPERAHAIPIAYVGSDIDNNLESMYYGAKGIKGAFWANFLSPEYVRMAGGEEKLRTALGGMRLDPLDDGGLRIVATDSPLPDDSEENRQRFLRLHAALQPAFISWEDTTPPKRKLLGYFYRERSSIVP